MNKHDVEIEYGLMNELALGSDYREKVSDVRKCEEPLCLEAGLICRSEAMTQYLCIDHGMLHGYCGSCGSFVPTYLDLLDKGLEVICRHCSDQGGSKELGIDPSNIFGPPCTE